MTDWTIDRKKYLKPLKNLMPVNIGRAKRRKEAAGGGGVALDELRRRTLTQDGVVDVRSGRLVGGQDIDIKKIGAEWREEARRRAEAVEEGRGERREEEDTTTVAGDASSSSSSSSSSLPSSSAKTASKQNKKIKGKQAKLTEFARDDTAHRRSFSQPHESISKMMAATLETSPEWEDGARLKALAGVVDGGEKKAEAAAGRGPVIGVSGDYKGKTKSKGVGGGGGGGGGSDASGASASVTTARNLPGEIGSTTSTTTSSGGSSDGMEDIKEGSESAGSVDETSLGEAEETNGEKSGQEEEEEEKAKKKVGATCATLKK